MVSSKAIHGRISLLAKLRPQGSSTDHIFIGTERFQYFTVSWDTATQQFLTVHSFYDIAEKHMRDSPNLDRISIDPEGKYLVLELFEGVLSIVQIVKPKRGRDANKYLEDPEQVRISELWVRSSTFLYTQTRIPKFAILYVDSKERVRLATYRITDDKGQTSAFDHTKDRENDIGDLDPGASMLIPVPKKEEGSKRYLVRNQDSHMMQAQMGGVIVVGETRMLYLDDESKAVVQYALDEASIFVAWETVDDERYLLADEYGRLHLLTLILDGAFVTSMDVRKIGEISQASNLVYMGDNILFVASRAGDSQVVRLGLDQNVAHVEVLQTMPNIAPITDFTIMDMGGRGSERHTNEYSSGQARIVTGSGRFQEGSLRSVRSGVGLEDLGLLAEMDNIRALFSLSSSAGSELVDTLVVSLVTETRVFKFSADAEIEEVEEYQGFSLLESTIFASNLPDNHLLQVTESGVRLIDNGRGVTVSSWNASEGQSITAAAANNQSLLISVNGTLLLSLDLKDSLQEIARQDLGENDQIASVHVPADISGIGLVGFWKSSTVSILNLANLDVIHGEELTEKDNASVPRNIVLTQVLPEETSGPTLFVAMADGTVLTFSVNKSDFTLSGRKSVILGTQQAGFQILPRKDGLNNVFATCEHPSLIYGDEGRIIYSAVTAEDAICICPFDSEAFPDSIVVATAEGIKISQVDAQRRTHVSTLHIPETIRRLAYSAEERLFGIGCIKRELIEGSEVLTTTFRLVDEVTFGELGKPYELSDSQSNSTELIECVIRATFPDIHGDLAERFLVGTSYLDEQTNNRGRILMFGVDSNRSPYLILNHTLKGACRQLNILNGKIVAALTKTVAIFSYTPETATTGSLEKLATYRTATYPMALAIHENVIAVGDMMQSISLLEYVPGHEGLPDALTEIARDYQKFWTTAVCHVDGDTWLECDHDGNLNMLRRNLEGVTENDKRRMQSVGEINLGEKVNTIRKVEVETSANASVIPRAFLATVSPSSSLPVNTHLYLTPASFSLRDLSISMQVSNPNIKISSFDCRTICHNTSRLLVTYPSTNTEGSKQQVGRLRSHIDSWMVS